MKQQTETRFYFKHPQLAQGSPSSLLTLLLWCRDSPILG